LLISSAFLLRLENQAGSSLWLWVEQTPYLKRWLVSSRRVFATQVASLPAHDFFYLGAAFAFSCCGTIRLYHPSMFRRQTMSDDLPAAESCHWRRALPVERTVAGDQKAFELLVIQILF
jgi:hypothetical protein